MAKKSVVWVSRDFFVDCDFNPEVLQEVLKTFNIHWIILLPARNARFAPKDFDRFSAIPGLTIEILISTYRQRDVRSVVFYWQLFRRIRRLDAQVNYINCAPDPYMVLLYWALPKDKSIFAVHDGKTHGSFDYRFLYAIVFKLAYTGIKYACLFSKSQLDLFKREFPASKTFYIPLALKNFGEPGMLRSDDIITFLCFGVINASKNIDLMIRASCMVYERGLRNFKVSINGACENWQAYSKLIKYPELFECRIRLIENSEIPDLFSAAHYFVQPYRNVSQSGAMKVAFNYNVPVIATRFPGFSDEVREGVNGFLFDSGNADQLVELMIQLISVHQCEYNTLQSRMSQYVRANYDSTAIGRMYSDMFNSILER